jgi:ABC-2 type transport system permease protein
VFSALFYLESRSIANRMLMRLKRLKQPKYLIGGIVGAIYFYFYFFRYLIGLPGRRPPTASFLISPESRVLLEALGASILLLVLLIAWLFPHGRAALTFSEAEVAFLFPAPISRRGLIHFKLLRSQAGILFAMVILMLMTNRFGGKAWIHAAGWWVILSTVNLHLLGSSFARTMLLERGITNWQRRVGILCLIVVVCVGVIVWAKQTLPTIELSQIQSGADFKEYLHRLIGTGPIPWLLYPFRVVIRPYMAVDARSFLAALGPALVLLGLHYWWVIRSNVAFEEASVEASRKLAEKVAAARSGKWQTAQQPVKTKRPPFRLRPSGAAAVALLWKNLISAGQAFTLRVWLLLGVIGMFVCISLNRSASGGNLAPALGMAAVMVFLWMLFLGPQVFRQDFRQDLPLADLLKLYPMHGWQIALGELLAPALILTGVQWFLLVAAAIFSSHASISPLGPIRGVVLCAGAALLAPMLNLITLQIPNAAVLLFPSWFQSGKMAAQGVEATGQRLIFLFGQLLVFIVALIPAAVVFGVVFLVAKMLVGLNIAIPLASAAAAVILAGEAALGVLLLGYLFDRFDVSAEMPGAV